MPNIRTKGERSSEQTWKLARPNIFQVDRGRSAEYSTEGFYTARLKCPHCSVLGVFQPASTAQVIYPKLKKHTGTGAEKAELYRATINICPNDKCAGLVFVISKANETITCIPPELIEFNSDNIPQSLTKTMKEAIACHGAKAYRAAAMLVRRLLEEICHENNAKGRVLAERIENLRSEIILSVDLFEAMKELKIVGNDAAHVEARDYDAVDENEAAISIEIALKLLEALYQHKPLVSRLRSLKKSSS